MERIAKSVLDLVGNTPLVESGRFAAARGAKARLIFKLEKSNPLCSAKDRAALAMVRAAERSGALKKGGTMVEPTSGNTGVGLAFVAAALGYRLVLTMPENMSEERVKLARALGAEIVLTPAAEGMAGAVARAERMAKEIPGAFVPDQFGNPANPAAHYAATGPEIWADTDGKVDAFVAGVGTGGTLSGVGRFLKEKNPDVRIVAAEPLESPLLSEGRAGRHGIQGIGANFVPANLDRSVVDEIVDVPTEAALDAARFLIREEGLLVGISSGAAAYAAAEIAAREEFRGKTVVALLPDTGERYLSTALFE